MDKTGVFIILAMVILAAYNLLDRNLKIKETKLQLMKNREISDIDLENTL